MEELTRLQEAPQVDVAQDDEEQDEKKYDPTVREPEPQNPAPPADVDSEPAPQKPQKPSQEPAQSQKPQAKQEPVSSPEQFDDPEPEQDQEPQVDAPEPEPDAVEDPADDVDKQQKLTKTKVKMFFNKLAKNNQLMTYLQFNSPTEQVEAIQQFAELVGVPRNQLVNLMTQMRQISREKQVENFVVKLKENNYTTKKLYKTLTKKMGMTKAKALKIIFESQTFGQYKKLSEAKKKALILKIIK